MEHIKHNDRGRLVAHIQSLFKQLGYSITVDGWFFDGTKGVIKKYQEDNVECVDDVSEEMLGTMSDATMRELMINTFNEGVVLLPLPTNQFYLDVVPKTQIALHHTASGRGVDGDFRHWLNTPTRIATAEIIGYDGKVYQTFNPMYWGWHLGLKHKNNKARNMGAIGIEIDAWGPLAKINGQFHCWTGKVVAPERVCTLDEPWRTIPKSHFFDDKGVTGQPAQHYERYTDAQINAVVARLKSHHRRFGVRLDHHARMFEVRDDAINGVPGVWSHASYRADKSDIFPQPNLIEALKTLSHETATT